MTTAPSSSADSASQKPASRRLILQLLATLASAVACNMPGIRHIAPASTLPPSSTATNTPTPTPLPTMTAEPPPVEPTAASAPLSGFEAAPRIIIDAHEDIAWNWLELGRNPAQDALEGRAQETGSSVQSGFGGRTVGLPQWLEGRIGIVFSTIFVMPQRHASGAWMTQIYATPGEAYNRAIEQFQRYEELAAREPQISLVKTAQDLDEVLVTWQTPDQPPVVGLVILMEGADPIEQPTQVSEWYDRGLRIVGPAWVQTRYAGGTGEPGPLTAQGRELLAAMAEVGMILDLSHLAEEAYLEAVDSYPGTVIASHANPRAFLPTDRGLSDNMIRRLAARGGVVGIVPYNRYLKPGWEIAHGRAGVPITTVVEAIDHVVQLTGNSAHVGIGSDFDGGFGVESIPDGMNTVADLAMISDGLGMRGYSDDDIAAIMNGNWLRVLRSQLP